MMENDGKRDGKRQKNDRKRQKMTNNDAKG